jgi:hypothetical protein
MTWKRCDGCTRAIASAAFTCEYCGHVCDDALEYLPSESLEERAGLPLVTPVEDAPSDPSNTWTNGTWSQALPPLELDESFAASPAPVTTTDADADAVAALREAPAAVTVPAAPSGARRLIMAGAALLVTSGLIITILSSRGSASPTPAAAPPPGDADAAAPARPAGPPRERSSLPDSAAVAPRWNRMTDGRWVGDKRNSVAFELAALDKIHIWTRAVTPVLVVRCEDGHAESFVFTESAARMETQDGNHTVRVAFDGAAGVTERWPDSDDHDALFAPDGTAFTQQLAQSRSLRFRFDPHNAPPATATFEVSGIGELLRGSARQCGWKN